MEACTFSLPSLPVSYSDWCIQTWISCPPSSSLVYLKTLVSLNMKDIVIQCQTKFLKNMVAQDSSQQGESLLLYVYSYVRMKTALSVGKQNYFYCIVNYLYYIFILHGITFSDYPVFERIKIKIPHRHSHALSIKHLSPWSAVDSFMQTKKNLWNTYAESTDQLSDPWLHRSHSLQAPLLACPPWESLLDSSSWPTESSITWPYFLAKLLQRHQKRKSVLCGAHYQYSPQWMQQNWTWFTLCDKVPQF